MTMSPFSSVLNCSANQSEMNDARPHRCETKCETKQHFSSDVILMCVDKIGYKAIISTPSGPKGRRGDISHFSPDAAAISCDLCNLNKCYGRGIRVHFPGVSISQPPFRGHGIGTAVIRSSPMKVRHWAVLPKLAKATLKKIAFRGQLPDCLEHLRAFLRLFLSLLRFPGFALLIKDPGRFFKKEDC